MARSSLPLEVMQLVQGVHVMHEVLVLQRR